MAYRLGRELKEVDDMSETVKPEVETKGWGCQERSRESKTL